MRYKEDRRGFVFNIREALEFNNFIVEAQMKEILLVDRRFTWINKSGSSMSKLDKIFCSQCFQVIWPDLHAISKGRVVYDHFPIMLQNKAVDFDPNLFRVFNTWLHQENFIDIISKAWTSYVHGKLDFRLKQKIKLLKNALKSAYHTSVVDIDTKVRSLRQEKEKWDSIVESKDLSTVEISDRDACFHNQIFAEKVNFSML